MKTAEAVLPALALAVLLLGAAGTASAATPGYAVYSVQLSSMGTSHAITVNESVSATSNAGYDKLILSVVSGNSTFSYSRSINSSLEVSPFLPSVTNQSFSYASGSTLWLPAQATTGRQRQSTEQSRRSRPVWSIR